MNSQNRDDSSSNRPSGSRSRRGGRTGGSRKSGTGDNRAGSSRRSHPRASSSERADERRTRGSSRRSEERRSDHRQGQDGDPRRSRRSTDGRHRSSGDSRRGPSDGRSGRPSRPHSGRGARNDQRRRQKPPNAHRNSDFALEDSYPTGPGDRSKRELVRGILEIGNQGFGFLRNPQKSFRIQPMDVHVGKHLVTRYRLRSGHYIVGATGGHRAPKGRGPSLHEIHTVDGDPPSAVPKRPFFKDLTSIDPTERFQLGTNGDLSMRLADLIAPVGRGQRALIVAPPRTGKTVLLQKMAQSITSSYPDVAVVTLLVDERPEEVTDWKRNVRAEVYASSSDENSKSHVRVAEMVLNRCHRLLESGCDVVLLLDSLTRLGRAFNLETAHSGRTLSGGVDAKTLEKPKAIFGAARNVEEGGSLTIIATALIETGSRMDEVIFEEFKGTGNMELVLSRKLADHRVFPAIDVTLSGTRKEEKLYTPEEIDQIWKLRRVLTNVNPIEGMELLSERVGAFEDNQNFLLSLKA